MRARNSALASAFVVGSIVLVALPLRGAPPGGAVSPPVEGATVIAPAAAPVQPVTVPPHPGATPLQSSAAPVQPLEPVQIVSPAPAVPTPAAPMTPALSPTPMAPGAPTVGASAPMSNLPSVAESLAASQPGAPVTAASPASAPAAPVTPIVPVAPVTSAPQPSGDWRTQAVQALDDYNTNGAGVLAVPTEGPAAEYFSNGGEVLSGPSSVIPESSFDVSFDMPAQPAL